MTSSELLLEHACPGAPVHHVIACLSLSRRVPDLEHYFAERAGALVRELAATLCTAAHTLSTPHGFQEFCLAEGLNAEQLDAARYQDELAVLAGRLVTSTAGGSESLVPYLVQDYVLLRRWIDARKGGLYSSLLFGSYRAIPFFEGEQCSTRVSEYLSGGYRDLPHAFHGLLVDDGRTLFIAAPGLCGDEARFTSLLQQYKDFYLWVFVFSD